MTTQVEQKKSPAARVTITHQRAIFALLEAYFDTEKEEYAEGWSDLKIAQEVGCTPAAVVYRREGAFGKLKKLPTKLTLADLRDAVDIVVERLTWIEEGCQNNFKEIDSAFDVIQEKINPLSVASNSHDAGLASMENTLSALGEKIKDLEGVQKIMTDTVGVVTEEMALPGETTIGQVVSILMEQMGELQGKVTKLLNAMVVAEVDDG